MIFSAGCSTTVSGDTYCVGTKHIPITQWQYDRMVQEPEGWRPLALDIKDHNDLRHKRCDK